MGLYFDRMYLLDIPRLPARFGRWGDLRSGHIRIPLTFFRLNYWRYTLNCLRAAQLFTVCPFDWRFEAISLSNDETIIKLHTHPSWVHPVTPFSRVITGVLASFL